MNTTLKRNCVRIAGQPGDLCELDLTVRHAFEVVEVVIQLVPLAVRDVPQKVWRQGPGPRRSFSWTGSSEI